MKKLIYTFVFALLSLQSFAQYKKVYPYNDYQTNWALVKTKSGTYGFIDKNKKQIVTPIYSKIGKFGIVHKNFAVIKSISDTYGLINKEGEVIVEAIYKNIGKFDELKKGYALVESITNHFGLINESGKEEIVPNLSMQELKTRLNDL